MPESATPVRLIGLPDQLPQYAKVAASLSGDNSVVTGTIGKRIWVLSYVVVAGAAVSAKWKSGAGTDLSGAMPLAANGGISAPPIAPAQGSYFVTALGEDLVLNLSAAINVGGHMSYYKEP